MSCTQCTSKFTVLHREHSCKKCGMSFCGKCLKHKIKLAEKDIFVCKSCFEKHQNPNVTKNQIDLPKNYLARVQQLEDKTTGSQSATGRSIPSGVASYSGEMYQHPKDKELAQRLVKLKTDQAQSLKTNQSAAKKEKDIEIAKRLAELKGVDPESYNKPAITVYQAPDSRTQSEQTHDLIEQIQREVEIDERPNQEIRDRLDNLRQNDSVGGENDAEMEANIGQFTANAIHHARNLPSAQDDKPIERSDVDKLMAVAQEEASEEQKSLGKNKRKEDEIRGRLEQLKQFNREKLGGHKPICSSQESASSASGSANVVEDDEEELPWCCICNNDASIRCRGCDGDLYCRRCFREGHDSFDLKEHETVKYTPPTH